MHAPSTVSLSTLPPPLSGKGSAAAVKISAPPAALLERGSFLSHLWLYCSRGFVHRLRSNGALADCASHLLAGFIIAICCSAGELFTIPPPEQYSNACPPSFPGCRRQIRNILSSTVFYICMTSGALCVPAATRYLGSEKKVYWREMSAGGRGSRVAYLLGRALADIPFAAMLALLYTGPLMLISAWRMPAEYMFVSN